MSERDIFLALLDITDPAERETYLDRTCGGDPALRERVEGLLRSHEAAGSFLDLPAGETPTMTQEGAGAADDEALSFLAPPGRPGSLGRLGHYEVLEVLGKGGFGIVFRAFDDLLQRVVAVKVLAPSLAVTSPARKRFLREARSSAAVRHENVVQVHAVEEKPLPYLVMELVPGETLQQRLDRTGPLDVGEVLRIGAQIAEGLAAAHEQGLIHRDIKPSNILMDAGPQQQAKITDFGLARAADDASLTRSGVIAGTPMYMSPEQARGEAVDQRSDLFSLGSVLYVLITGRSPFRAENTPAVLKRVCEDTPRPIREVIPEVPDWLCRVVEKLHAKDREGRYQSAREVADVLADCEAQLKAHGALRDFSRIPGGGLPRRARWRWAVAALLLPLLAVGGWGLMRPPARNPVGRAGVRDADGADVRQADAATDAGWTSMFNGKDFTGWDPSSRRGNVWTLEGGALVNRVASRRAEVWGPVYSIGPTYRDFHLRVEAKLSAGARGGFTFRRFAAAGPNGRYGISFREGGHVSLFRGEGVRQELQVAEGAAWPPEAWFLLEVIAVGRHITARIDGKEVIAWQDPDAGAAAVGGPICFGAGNAGAILSVRKVEIKDLSADPPVNPFVVLTGEGAVRARTSGLVDAVAAAQPGDVVEVRGNGPFVTTGIGITRPLTIRAGTGFIPVVEHDRLDGLRVHLLSSTAGLRLEGLTLINPLPHGTQRRGLVAVTGAPFLAANCRFVSTSGLCTAASSRAELLNCLFASSWGLASAIGCIEPPSHSRLRMANCVSPNWALFLFPGAKPLRDARFTFDRCTFTGPLLASCWTGGELLGDGTGPAPLRLSATDCLIQCPSLFRTEMHPKFARLDDWPLDRTDRLARFLLAWEGRGNVYLPTTGYVLFHGDGKGTLAQAFKKRDEWRKAWGARDGEGLEAVAAFRGEAKLGRSPLLLSASDFRLAPGSPGQGKGADISLVGPGAPYEAWRKSPEYAAWRKRVGGLMEGGGPAP